MIWTIAKREILDNLLSSKFALATILCLILVALGSYVSIKDYERRMKEYSASVQDEKGERTSDMPNVYRKPEILSIFSQGMERKTGNTAGYTDYSGMGKIELKGEMMGASQSLFLRSLTPIDFGFVVRVVISLLAVFLAYDTISGEREAGVLKLNLANPVPRSHILIGKFLGGILCLCIPLIMSIIVGVLIIQLSGSVQFGSAEWIRLGIIFMLSILYLIVFYSLGLFVSCLTKTSAMSLMLSMLIWILIVVLIPNVGPGMVRQFWHTTSKEELNNRFYQIEKDFMEKENKKFGPFEKRDRSEKTQAEWQELYNERVQSLWKLNQEFAREQDRQTEAGRWIARLSPSSAYSFSSDAFARTDVGTYKRFITSIYIFFTQIDASHRLAYTDKNKYKDFAEKYEYSFKMPESVGDSFNDAVPDIALLLLFSIFFFMGAYAVFIRYDVR